MVASSQGLTGKTPTVTTVVFHLGAAMSKRVSRRKLEEYKTILGTRDKAIIRSIQAYRYLSTSQISRLLFLDAPTKSAALRAASRNLNKLKELHLIESLSRRIGGVDAGSGSSVWFIDTAGEHLLRLLENSARPHKKSFEPSPYFLAHTLAVSEIYIRLTEISRNKGMHLKFIQNEPHCWRPYSSSGKIVSLKPDLYAITICDEYEDRWFFEIDLDTESPIKIIEKCQRYYQYYRSGIEQNEYGVFPLVVWIVPDAGRKNSLEHRIKAEFSNHPNIFVVITPGEFEDLIQQGAGNSEGGNS